MDETKIPGNSLSPEQAQNVGGGSFSCSPDEILPLIGQLTEGYENLIQFATYVIERVIGPPAP
jgi:hypothetical protein